MKMKNNNVDELVEMIDKLMGEGNGHINVIVDENEERIKVETSKSNDCGLGACSQPTELEEENDEDE